MGAGGDTMIVRLSPAIAGLQEYGETADSCWRRFDLAIDRCKTVEEKIALCRQWFGALLPDSERQREKHIWGLIEVGEGCYGKRIVITETVNGKYSGVTYYISGGRLLRYEKGVERYSRHRDYVYVWKGLEKS